MQIQWDTQLFSDLFQYSQSTMVVEICEQDLHTLKGANPLIWPLPTIDGVCM